MRKNYYITTHGKLKRKDNTLLLDTGEGKKRIPIKNVSGLHLLAQLDFNTRFFSFLSKEKIPAHFYDWFGIYRGSYYPKEFLNAGLVVVRQAEHYNDIKKRIVLAKEVVLGASHNMLRNLKYYKRKGRDVGAVMEEIESLRDRIGPVKKPDELLGFEGKIRERYYRTFTTILRKGFVFHKRVNRPPDNEVNAMISFGNSLLYATTVNEIYRTQLNPTISYLHEPRERRFSLSLDISEVFKPLLVDKTIFKVVNKQLIKPKDFDKNLNNCLLNDGGRKTFIKEYESRLEKKIQHKGLGRNVSQQRLIRLECYKLLKHVVGDIPYVSYKR